MMNSRLAGKTASERTRPNVMNVVMDMPILPTEREVMAVLRFTPLELSSSQPALGIIAWG